MAQDIAGGLRNVLPGPLDSLMGPYASLAAACTAIPNVVTNVGGVPKNFREGKFVIVELLGIRSLYLWDKDYTDAGLSVVSQKVINDLITGGTSSALSAEMGKFISSLLPKSFISQSVPASQPGYYRTKSPDIGGYTGNATYLSYTIFISEYILPLYATFRIRDDGTAGAFYYRADGSLISYQFRGTVSDVDYINQLLTIPEGTVKINFTTLATVPLKLYYTQYAQDILSKTAADILYPSLASIQASYAPISILPGLPNLNEIIFNKTDFTLTTGTGGDTNNAYYIDKVNIITKDNVPIKRFTVKVTAADKITLCVVKIEIVNSVTSITVLHVYKAIDVSATGEYTITDNYLAPKGSYVGAKSNSNNLSLRLTGGNSFRSNTAFSSVTNSSVQIALNFVTGDSSVDASPSLSRNLAFSSLNKFGFVGLWLNITTGLMRIKVDKTNPIKIFLYGDSRFSSDYPWLKPALELLTGATVVYGGFPGATAAQLAADSRLNTILSANADITIVLMGGNDNGLVGTVGTFGSLDIEPVVSETDATIEYSGSYFCQAIDHIQKRYKAWYYDIRSRAAGVLITDTQSQKDAKLATFNSKTESERANLTDALLKPVLVFCTDLPQKRSGGGTPGTFSAPASWLRKRNSIVECCNKNNINCVDTMYSIGIDMDKEPSFPGTTDKNTNYGIYTMDGLHQNKWCQQKKLAPIICDGIGII